MFIIIPGPSGQQTSRKFLPWLICASKTVIPHVTESDKEGGLTSGANSPRNKRQGEPCIVERNFKKHQENATVILQFEFLGTVMTFSVGSGIWTIVILQGSVEKNVYIYLLLHNED